jgi:crotonobetainyl-CoA:carnitine CoA-transferase CaiB-like acyl-CoA transferase
MSSLQGSLLGWDAVVKWIATVEPAIAEELSDPTWKSAAYRATVEAKARFREIFERFSAPRPKRWLYEEGQGFGVSIAPLTTPSDICADPHLEARGFFGSAASDGAGTTVGHPAAPFRLPDLPGHWRDWRAPEPLRFVDRPEWTPRRRRRPGTPARRPLEGIRVIDFTWVGVGPFATKFLADNGADVIKVESATRLDPIRMMHPAAEGKPGVNRSGYFANRNSSKRAITLNLKSEPGIDIAHRLIAGADIVINNFRPGVMQSNRLGPDDLRSIREDLIYVDMPMMGSGGPYSKFGGYGLVMTAVGGLFGLTGLPGRQPVGTGTNYPDHVPNPLHAAMAILAALRRRDRTGEGAYVEISQVESTLALLGPHLMRALAGGEDPVVPGNRHGDHAPQGVFPCVEDGWCALTVRGDEDWAALCRLLDRADLAGRFARAEDRRAAAAQPEIEAALAAWTATRTSAQAMEQLLAAGVPAGAVQDAREVLFDPQLAHRRHWVRLEHPEMGVAVYDGPVAQLSQTPAVLSRPAPLLGQHTREVCAELLGIAGDDFEALRACGTFD